MISFKFGIFKHAIARFASYGIVVSLVPNVVVGSFYSVFPNSIWTSAKPFHAGNNIFGITECQSKIVDIIIGKGIVKPLASSGTVEHYSIHIQQSVWRHSPNYRIYSTQLMCNHKRIGAVGARCDFRKTYFHSYGYWPVIEWNN